MKATIKLPSGKTFIVIAENLSDQNIYAKSVFLNDKKLDRSFITFQEVNNGGELRFEMTN